VSDDDVLPDIMERLKSVRVTPKSTRPTIKRGVSPTPRRKNLMTGGDVVRIISPVKLKTVRVQDGFSSENGLGGSSDNTPGPSNPHAFLITFIDLQKYFKEKMGPDKIKATNKAIKKLSISSGFPEPEFVENLSDKKVSQSIFSLSSGHGSDFSQV
jgi:hypothetical protein